MKKIPTEVASLSLDQIVITSHVGELVKSFERKVAWFHASVSTTVSQA